MIPRPLLIGVAAMVLAAAGMGFYVWQMKGRSVAREPLTDTRPVPPPASGTPEQVTLCLAYDDPGLLLPQLARIPLPEGRQQRAEELLRALLNIYLEKSSPHTLGTGSDIREVFLIDPGLAVVDLNTAFADGHRSDILVEELTVASLVQTLSMNVPGITRVKFLVDGKERDTLAGHADLSGFYDVSAVSQLLAQMDER
jgi:hypothetical protein